ncbi:MAG: type I methionyl aminopeptidase, partial [Alteromonadales bacterium]|nr:type I methionyl aminopeptidase [Alteromonadales bacterium]
MAVKIKSGPQIERMREAGKIVAYTHEVLKANIKPGITTKELDMIAEKEILKYNAIPAFKGYGGFPASICTSVNDQVVHGIPGPYTLKDGDIISIDIGAYKDNFFGDAAKTHSVGNVSEKAQKLIDVTRNSFYEGLKYCKIGYRLSDISHAIQTYVESYGFSIVRDYVGHGIGTALHEDPQIPNYGNPGRGLRLAKGMILAIEPMVNEGKFDVKTLDDDWTVVTIDGKNSSHYEHTVAITDDEPMLLTSME